MFKKGVKGKEMKCSEVKFFCGMSVAFMYGLCECYCTVCDSLICIFFLNCLFYVIRPVLWFIPFELLLCLSFLFYFFVCFAFYFVCSAICIVSPYVCCCASLLCPSVRITATGWKPNCSKQRIVIRIVGHLEQPMMITVTQ